MVWVEYVKKDEKGDPSAKKDSHMLDDLDLHAPDTLDSALGIYIHWQFYHHIFGCLYSRWQQFSMQRWSLKKPTVQ